MPPAAEEELTVKQAARILDVHYMTAYRYVRSGRLPARRDGNVWVIAAADVAALHAAGPVGQVVDGSGRGRSVDWSSRMRARLVVGDEAGAWRTVESALVAGLTAEEVLVDVIGDAVAATTDADGPAAGYLATATAQRTSAVLGARFRRAGRSRGAVVLGAPEGEGHAFALAMVADLLRLRNVGVRELGCMVPPLAFADAVDRTDGLVAVAIGVTATANLDAAAMVIAAVRRSDADVPVVLGGQAVRNPEVAAATGATGWAADVRGLVALVEARLPASRGGWARPVADGDARHDRSPS